jgi:hypothetical protein
MPGGINQPLTLIPYELVNHTGMLDIADGMHSD